MATNKQESLLGFIEPYQSSKDEEYMSEAMRGHFVRILEQWKRNLMEEVDRTVSHMKEEAANFADPADRATQEEEFSLELRTRDRERKLIKRSIKPSNQLRVMTTDSAKLVELKLVCDDWRHAPQQHNVLTAKH